MSVLTRAAIRQAIATGRIRVAPLYDQGDGDTQIAETSIDLYLHPKLLLYTGRTGRVFDLAKHEEPTAVINLAEHPDGFILRPGNLYLGSTIERLCAPAYVAFLAGKSSPARLGLRVEAAGMIEPGFDGQVTLEIKTELELTVYEGSSVAQVRFETLEGLPTSYAERGHYQDQHDGPVPSRSHLQPRRHVGYTGGGL